MPDTTHVKMLCIHVASLQSIVGLPDKYGTWNELYRARPALVRFGIVATVPATKPPRQCSAALFHLPVTQSPMKIFTGKTSLPSLTRYFSGSLCSMGYAETKIKADYFVHKETKTTKFLDRSMDTALARLLLKIESCGLFRTQVFQVFQSFFANRRKGCRHFDKDGKKIC